MRDAKAFLGATPEELSLLSPVNCSVSMHNIPSSADEYFVEYEPVYKALCLSLYLYLEEHFERYPYTNRLFRVRTMEIFLKRVCLGYTAQDLTAVYGISKSRIYQSEKKVYSVFARVKNILQNQESFEDFCHLYGVKMLAYLKSCASHKIVKECLPPHMLQGYLLCDKLLQRAFEESNKEELRLFHEKKSQKRAEKILPPITKKKAKEKPVQEVSNWMKPLDCFRDTAQRDVQIAGHIFKKTSEIEIDYALNMAVNDFGRTEKVKDTLLALANLLLLGVLCLYIGILMFILVL